MHHQRSKYALRQLQIGACHVMLHILLGAVAFGSLAYTAFRHDERGVYISLGLVALWVVSCLVFFFKASGTRCSLCMTPLWVGRKCQKHRNAKPAFGVSYRLELAISLLFKDRYRCPYCGESFSTQKVRGGVRRRK